MSITEKSLALAQCGIDTRFRDTNTPAGREVMRAVLNEARGGHSVIPPFSHRFKIINLNYYYKIMDRIAQGFYEKVGTYPEVSLDRIGAGPSIYLEWH